ncbi:MAG: DUF2892 domain-containing protein [Candidatus Parcubacteria bacterium]|nr:DUF2892 domain-containing protein [Burkholderiales bacterium]
MKANVGGADRAVRIAAGLLLLAAIPLLDAPLRWWGLLGLLPLATGVIGYCPAYLPFGLSTCRSVKSTG